MSRLSTTPAIPDLAPPADPAPRRRFRVQRSTLSGLAPLVAVLALGGALTAANPRFIDPRSLSALADSAAPLAMLAIGATLVVMCGGIDLSIGALASLSSVLLAMWIPTLGPAAIPAVVATAAAAGLLQGVLHVVFRIPSFVVTLGGMAIFSAIALVISDAGTVPVTDTSVTKWAFDRIGDYIPTSVILVLVVVTLVAVVLRVTPVGTWIAAIGYTEPAARLAGLPVYAVKVAAFTLSGTTAGLAAVLLVARTYAGNPTMADSLLLPAVAAIVVGGTAITGGHGGLWRTMAGAIIVTMLRVGLSVVGVPSAYESILYGVLVIGAVAMTIDRSKVGVIK